MLFSHGDACGRSELDTNLCKSMLAFELQKYKHLKFMLLHF